MRDKKIGFIVVVCIVVVFACILFWPTPVRKDLRKMVASAEAAKVYSNEINTQTKMWNTNMNVENQELAYNKLLSDVQYTVKQVIVPNIEQIVSIFQMAELETPEVIYFRDELCNICTLYSESSLLLLKGVKANDEEMVEEASQKLDEMETRALKYEEDFKAFKLKNWFIYLSFF